MLNGASKPPAYAALAYCAPTSQRPHRRAEGLPFPIATQLSTDLPHSLDGTRGGLFLGEQLTPRAECTWSAAFLLFQYLPEGLEVPCGFLTQSLHGLPCPICKVSIHTTSALIVSRLAIDAPRADLG